MTVLMIADGGLPVKLSMAWCGRAPMDLVSRRSSKDLEFSDATRAVVGYVFRHVSNLRPSPL